VIKAYLWIVLAMFMNPFLQKGFGNWLHLQIIALIEWFFVVFIGDSQNANKLLQEHSKRNSLFKLPSLVTRLNRVRNLLASYQIQLSHPCINAISNFGPHKLCTDL
jgi:hypothetical protein